MTKQELAKELAHVEGFSIQQSNHVIDTLFDIIASGMERRENIKIRRFGTFTVCKRKEKTFKNPTTKEVRVIPQRECPDFIASHYLKERIEKGGLSNG